MLNVWYTTLHYSKKELKNNMFYFVILQHFWIYWSKYRVFVWKCINSLLLDHIPTNVKQTTFINIMYINSITILGSLLFWHFFCKWFCFVRILLINEFFWSQRQLELTGEIMWIIEKRQFNLQATIGCCKKKNQKIQMNQFGGEIGHNFCTATTTARRNWR